MWSLSPCQMFNVLEIPFTSATLLDATLKARIPAVRKYRQGLHRTLDRGIQVSVGRAGTIHLNAVPVIQCTAVAARWRPTEAKQLEEAYRGAGLGKLMASSRYGSALERAGNSLRGVGITKGADTARQISRRIAELTMTDKVVQEVAVRMGEIFRKVVDRLGEMRRFSGRVVRYDGPRALITVNTGEREELRVADSRYLFALGLQDRGAPFLLHQFKWSPDSTMSLYIPAVDLGGDPGADLALEQRLKDAEQSLPEPPDISLD